MSLEPVLTRIAQIDTLLADPSTVARATASGAAPNTPTAATATTASVAAAATPQTTTSGSAPSPSSFASLLESVLSPEESATASILNPDDSSASDSDPLASNATSTSTALENALTSTSQQSGTASTAATASPLSGLLAALGGGAGTSATAFPSATATTATTAGNPTIVGIAETQVGQQEVPLGSNNGPAVAEYRSAVAGATPGEPWCAQFASWVARQAGVPIGPNGEGLSAVSQVWSWAQQTGRAIPNGPGVVPAPGDLIVFGDEHVGIVSGVLPNGDIETVEGNFDNRVVNNIRGPGEATGYVSMSPSA
jgi:hypothetical protein